MLEGINYPKIKLAKLRNNEQLRKTLKCMATVYEK